MARTIYPCSAHLLHKVGGGHCRFPAVWVDTLILAEHDAAAAKGNESLAGLHAKLALSCGVHMQAKAAISSSSRTWLPIGDTRCAGLLASYRAHVIREDAEREAKHAAEPRPRPTPFQPVLPATPAYERLRDEMLEWVDGKRSWANLVVQRDLVPALDALEVISRALAIIALKEISR